ncbi:protein-disulfide reductase DsbD domain-containing protein [Rhizobium sp. GN54]|uniref:protein-disulfide reductase DsbD domain-containing protein n=1 Tax=Rhizobium sp. GN54 TaxID=2898150 RepID=UPI001E36423F|nr:protein-disulfide reductase DsbD domain-containing protein [Rhizobium sp. GN54]MCD2180781.1 hypothetical protein [Rhizobium sp. GN54]
MTGFQTGFRFPLLALALLAISPGAGSAATSPWAETEGGRVRLIVLPEEADGRIPALLDIELQPGWKTYWRDPGESGISPTVTMAPESGLVVEAIRFPLPKRFSDGFTAYTGYDRSLALPLTLKRQQATQGDRITASVFLGVCENICIPLQAELSVDMAKVSVANPIEAAMAAAAEAALPAAASPDFAVTEARWNTEGSALSVTFTAPEPSAEKPLQVFVSGPEGFQFETGAAPVRSGESYRVDVPLRHKPKAASLDDAALLFTAESGGRAMEMPLVID